MITLLEKFNKEQMKSLPELKPGDTIKVHQKMKEGDKDAPADRQGKIQIFEGIIIAKKHGEGVPATITVRKVVDGIGVERIFPIHSPSINKIEIVRRAKVRRAKLYYLRTAKGKNAKLKRKDFAAAIADEPTQETSPEKILTEPSEVEKTPS
jgi:large subunit ribosomal protein L19